MSVLIIGEQPNGTLGSEGPLGGAAAARLAALAGVDVDRVLAHRRVNLIEHNGVWDASEARLRAETLDLEGPPVPFLLLGRRVADAFGMGCWPFFVNTRLASGRSVTLLPHPSGRCRVWNDPTARDVARRMLRPIVVG